jgi:hypothetical protein
MLSGWRRLNGVAYFGGHQEKSRPGVTPDGFLMRLPARHCSGSIALSAMLMQLA